MRANHKTYGLAITPFSAKPLASALLFGSTLGKTIRLAAYHLDQIWTKNKARHEAGLNFLG